MQAERILQLASFPLDPTTTIQPAPGAERPLQHPLLKMNRLATELRRTLTPLQKQALVDALTVSSEMLPMVGLTKSQSVSLHVVIIGEIQLGSASAAIRNIVAFFQSEPGVGFAPECEVDQVRL
jgi:hypothetical protein